MVSAVIFFLAGIVGLVVGAEMLVRGASRLALALGISPLVIGLTVVAFGTSAPELTVSVIAGLRGRPDLALGNVIGSNIFNILFVLGTSALVAPLVVSHRLVRLDVPLMIGLSILLLVLALDGSVGRADGVLLTVGIVVYTVAMITQGRREGAGTGAAPATEPAAPPRGRVPGWSLLPSRARDGILVGGGVGLLVLGSHGLVDGAVVFARALGLSELVIGLTIVAGGTSLPEFATSVLASIRGERDIAVGNIVGSNIFNILAILGIAALVSPGGIPVAPAALTFDIPVMIAVAVACVPIFFTGQAISRWEGLLFVGYYIAYSVYVVLAARQHDALDEFSLIMLEFVLPLTVVTLVVLVLRKRTLR